MGLLSVLKESLSGFAVDLRKLLSSIGIVRLSLIPLQMLMIVVAFYTALSICDDGTDSGIAIGIAFFLLFVILSPVALLIIRFFCNEENEDKVDSLMIAGGMAMIIWIIIINA